MPIPKETVPARSSPSRPRMGGPTHLASMRGSTYAPRLWRHPLPKESSRSASSTGQNASQTLATDRQSARPPKARLQRNAVLIATAQSPVQAAKCLPPRPSASPPASKPTQAVTKPVCLPCLRRAASPRPRRSCLPRVAHLDKDGPCATAIQDSPGVAVGNETCARISPPVPRRPPQSVLVSLWVTRPAQALISIVTISTNFFLAQLHRLRR
jgi:hypothetical protein